MGVRVLLVGHYFEGIDLAESLLKSGTVEFCYNADSSDDDTALDTTDNIHFPRRYGKNADYSKFCNISELPALSEKDLKAMSSFLMLYMDLTCRTTQFPIDVYQEEKSKYYIHFRFWKHILSKYNINLVLMKWIPHVRLYHAVLYALAQAYQIPLIIINDSNISYTAVVGNSIEGLGKNIGEYYEKTAKHLDITSCVLEGEVKAFYEKYEKHDVAGIMSKAFAEEQRKLVAKHYYGPRIGHFSFLLPYKTLIIKLLGLKYHLNGKQSAMRKASKENALVEFQNQRQQMKRIRRYLKHDVTWLEEYNRMAEEPDYSKKYIYFALQLTPEATTVPQAGVFGDQITSVQLIAGAARKCGVMVYVKEHYVQNFRSRWYYDAIKNIPNVRLIKTSVTSDELLGNCIAAATQTGTVILESAFRGKPVLVTSDGSCWKGFPTMFRITDEEQGATIINSILSGFEVNMDDVKRYFYAIQMNSITWDGSDRVHDPKIVAPDYYWREISETTNLIKTLYKKDDGEVNAER